MSKITAKHPDHWDDGLAIPPCFSCAEKDPLFSADVIAMVPHKDGGGKIAFAAPLCDMHAPHGLVGGWHPQYPISSAEGRKAWDEHGFGNPDKEPTP